MNLTELQAEVILITNRPDLVTRTLSAVKAATLKCHHSDFYAKDVVESLVQFPSLATEQSLDTITTFPLWRALKYIRPVDSVSGIPVEPPLKVITPEEILDGYGYTKKWVTYEAGQNLQILLETEYSQFLIGYYSHPNLSSYNSWIANMYPYAIVYNAAADIFKGIGQQEMEAAMRMQAAEQIALIKLSNIQAVGY